MFCYNSTKMSDLSGDSKNDYLSVDVNITGPSKNIDSSDSGDRTGALAEQSERTSDDLSDISDIPTLRRLATPTRYA